MALDSGFSREFAAINRKVNQGRTENQVNRTCWCIRSNAQKSDPTNMLRLPMHMTMQRIALIVTV
ncbi:MAG: hypothetical protein AAGB06_00555 [Verrucomicrobiota bacterium]